MNNRLTLRARPNDYFLNELEQESIALFHEVKAAVVSGLWEPSLVEEKYLRLRDLLLTTSGVLRGFRHSFLAAGRLNFPDSPRPKEYYLQWDNGLAGQKRAGALHLLKMAIRLYRHQPFKLEDLDDNLVGQPARYRIPNSVRAGLVATGRHFFKLRNHERLGYHVTEAQIRFLYYRMQISKLVGYKLGSVLEIGAGYGGLAAELLQRISIGQYLVAELPDAIPLAYFYMRACFDCPIQVLYRPEDRVDPTAQIVILAPWKLPDLNGEVALLINTMGFQHMSQENLDFYFAEIDRLRPKWMYLVNRNTQRDSSDIILDDYPFPSNYRMVKDSSTLFWPIHSERWYRDARSGEVQEFTNWRKLS